MAPTTSTKRKSATLTKKPAAERMSLTEVMSALEKAGTAQTRKIYARHGAKGPMFGVSFAELKKLVNRIGVDHELALGLWKSGNHDARTLAAKVADPTRMTRAELDRWAKDFGAPRCTMYVAALAAEGPHGWPTVKAWLASKNADVRSMGWGLAGQLAARDEAAPDAWFAERVAEIERGIHAAPNVEREAMNFALIAIGGRSPALRRAAVAAAKRIGKVEIDYGETSCKTPDAAAYVEKTWAHAAAKRFESPSAQERARESVRTRC